MATKKPDRPVQTANGAPVTAQSVKKLEAPPLSQEGKPPVEPARPEPRPARKTKAQLEQQVHSLEVEVARLKAELDEIRGPEVPWWKKISGSHADDPEAFNEAMRLGREWRDSFRPKERSSRKKSPKTKSRKVKSSDGRP